MYQQHWQLARRPFDNISDADFFVRSPAHHGAVLKMKYVIENQLGAGALVGGPGSGKSYLAARLRDDAGPYCRPFVSVLFPQMSASELMGWIACELSGNETWLSDGPIPLDRTVRQIETALRTINQAGSHPVVMIDDAHLIDDVAVFEALHQLLNFHEQPGTHFSLLLLGDPSLLAMIRRHRQLDDRVAVRAVVPEFELQDTLEYIQSRLQVAGAEHAIFSQEAIETIHAVSGGVPRRINRLCELALLVGYADGLTQIDAGEIEAVADEVSQRAAA